MIIIEHLEDVLSPWLFYEYKHSAEIYPKLLITNVRDYLERIVLSEYCNAISLSITDIPFKKIVVLDPLADEPLTQDDFKNSVIVVGGILGDHPPRGRTRELLSSKVRCETRTLGEGQFSIDSAVYIASMVEKGISIDSIDFVDGFQINIPGKYERIIELPYRYPIVNGRVLISEELLKYIREEMELDDHIALRSGKAVSIVDKIKKHLSLR